MMESIFTNLKRRFTNGNMLVRLIFINVAIFVIASIWLVLTGLFKFDGYLPIRYLELASYPLDILIRPWTLITYMFLHTNFLHLVFNMLWLYWFGQLFLMKFTPKQLVGVYFLGGLAGGLLYVLCYNLFPYFEQFVYNSYLLGASASVLAIVVAISVVIPDYELPLMFIGRVKLKYIAIVTVALSFFNAVSDNAGGNIAHLGGALLGFLFAKSYMKGTDITRWVSKVLDAITNMFKPRSNMKVSKGAKQRDMDYNKKKKESLDEIDAILDKIKRCGYEGLSADEKRKLFNAGKK